MTKRAKGGNIGSVMSTTKGVQVGTLVQCTDNSGVKLLKVISVTQACSRLKRRASASVGAILVCSVKKGKEDQLGKVVRAVLVRQRKYINRKGSPRIKFENNAAAMLNDNNEIKASSISGPVAKECLEKFPKVGSISHCVV
eukprot:GAHX01000053.1.p1 GENE.GAHX01000053.1~~GAHX01000053.1.p1  ORF type:complete len:141 (+),score=24.73 GAHX01000053.1:45-467(+)